MEIWKSGQLLGELKASGPALFGNRPEPSALCGASSFLSGSTEKGDTIVKKVLMSMAFCLVSASAFADPALVIMLDDGNCYWSSPTTYSEGNVHFVLNDGDLWVLSCHGEVVEGELPDRTYVAISSDANPEHLCTTPFGSTYNVRSVTTPAGKGKLTCWGVPGD